MPLFVGWARTWGGAWKPIAEGGSYEHCLENVERRLHWLPAGLGNSIVILPEDIDPNDRPPRVKKGKWG